jgi:hypothetical protein
MPTKTTVPHNARFPLDLSQRINEDSNRSGLTSNDIMTTVLQKHYGLLPDPMIALLLAVAGWVTATYQPDAFPDDLILVTARHIRDTPALLEMYQAAITGEDGKPDAGRKKLLSQKLGRCVKRAVRAETFARSLQVPTKDDLISSFSLLRPSPPSPEAVEKEVVASEAAKADRNEPKSTSIQRKARASRKGSTN